MFTIIRPIAAVLLAVFAVYAAQAYEPIYDPEADLGSFPVWAAGVSFVVGWMFLGGQVGRSLWYSAFVGIQAVILAAIATAAFLAVGVVFNRGYNMRYGEVIDAITGYFGIIVDWLTRGLVPEFLILMGVGGTVVGIILHILWSGMEKRRNAR